VLLAAALRRRSRLIKVKEGVHKQHRLVQFSDWRQDPHQATKMVNASITSNSSTAQSVADGPARHMNVAAVVIYSVIFVTGTVGNGLVIYVTGFRMKKTVNSVWFLNLALADFLFTAFLLFVAISTFKEKTWPFGYFMCKLTTFVGVVNMFASVFLLMAISLDRCLSIWVVVWAQNKRTVHKAQIMSAVIWMVAVVCSTPYATFRETV
ncbi:hypothetical protein INR49_024226, partial [Caranx melampygus]